MMNPYFNQPTIDRINAQINELEKMRNQMQQPIQPPTNLTQNFQLAPTTRDVIRYASSMEEVQRDMVIGDTPYFSKDMSVVWIKNIKGEIKTYELNEILPKDITFVYAPKYVVFILITDITTIIIKQINNGIIILFLILASIILMKQMELYKLL